MFDFSTLQLNTQEYSTTTVAFTFVLAFFLSSLIALTYQVTSRQVARPNNFIQALILISIVAALVILAIGDSIAFGLGMIGALSIIRFRTTLRNPRNITFMFMSIGVGIACGVYGFSIAILGTLVFCLAAFVLKYSPYSNRENLIGKVRIRLPKNPEKRKEIEAILRKYCTRFNIQSYRLFNSEKRSEMLEYEYNIILKNDENGWQLRQILRSVEETEEVVVFFENREGLI